MKSDPLNGLFKRPRPVSMILEEVLETQKAQNQYLAVIARAAHVVTDPLTVNPPVEARCCQITLSGKHQPDCPRILYANASERAETAEARLREVSACLRAGKVQDAANRAAL